MNMAGWACRFGLVSHEQGGLLLGTVNYAYRIGFDKHLQDIGVGAR